MRFIPSKDRLGEKLIWLNDNIAVIENYISFDMCESLIELAEPKLQVSVIVDDATGSDVLDDRWRKSLSCYLERGNDIILEDIEEYMDYTIDGGDRGSEPLHILKYEPNGFYKPHYDWFKTVPVHGQRIATLLMYLNTPESGGELEFSKLDLKIVPKKGMGVFFSYENCDPLSLHASLPLHSGVKYVATKWFRV